MKHKECFLNDTTCNPINRETGMPVIKEAHILSQGATMKQLCGIVNNQNVVYKVSTGKPEGWRKASAYHCFCGIHDDELFKPIENDNAFDHTDLEQLFLHSFRSFAYEYHQKRIEMDGNYELVKGLTDMLTSVTSIFGENADSSNDLSNDLDSRYEDHMYAHEKIKTKLTQAARTKNYQTLLYKAYVIQDKFPLASAGTLMADIVSTTTSSFVHYDPDEPQLARPGIILTAFPDPHRNSTNLIIAGLKDDQNAITYLEKFNSMTETELELAVSSLILTTNRKNSFLHPDYWNKIQDHPD